MDVNSGSVHVVDPLLYDMIALLSETIDNLTEPQKIPEEAKQEICRKLEGKYRQEEMEEAFSDIQELIDQEQLFTADIYKDYVIDFKKRKTVVKALCLHIAHDCNLACRYCFAEEGEYHGRRALMTYEVGKKALDFLVANSGNRINLEVDFFGGEPLMNWDVVKQLVAYGRSLEKTHNKKFRFTLTTNGVLLNDEIMEFCNKEMSNVVLSLDGRKEVNDRMRPFRNGNSRNLRSCGEIGITLCAEPSRETIWILQTMCCTLPIWALRKCPSSRLWLPLRSPTPSARRISRRSWRSTTGWLRNM